MVRPIFLKAKKGKPLREINLQPDHFGNIFKGSGTGMGLIRIGDEDIGAPKIKNRSADFVNLKTAEKIDDFHAAAVDVILKRKRGVVTQVEPEGAQGVYAALRRSQKLEI